MIRWLALIALFPAVAVAQIAAPTEVVPPTEKAGDSGALPTNVTPAVSIGHHICPGYPESTVQNRIQGKTRVAFTITAQGTVSGAAVEESSGNQQLDLAALMCVEGWLYKPATRDGQPVAAPWKIAIDWSIIPRGDMPASGTPAGNGAMSVPVWARGGFSCEQWHSLGSSKPEHPVVLTFFVEPDGSVKDVTVAQSSGHPDIDKDAVDCLSERHYIPAKQGGEPVEVHISDFLY
jgi:periplasmic protein TonB